MTKASTTIKQSLRYEEQHSTWFAATQALFDQVAAFYAAIHAALGSTRSFFAHRKLWQARREKAQARACASWKAAVLERLHTVFEADGLPDADRLRIAELEQLVGRQAYELEILKKASSRLASLPARSER